MKTINRYICIALAIILCFFLQNSILPFLTFLYTIPNLLLILTVSMGLMHGEGLGLIVGLVCGIMTDSMYGSIFGFYGIAYMFIGYFNGYCHKYISDELIALPPILCALSTLSLSLYIFVFNFLLRNRTNIGFYFTRIMLPDIIFTMVVSLLFYPAAKSISNKFDELEKRSADTFA